MKKTLIALAVIAASGAALAQSTVSLTGKLRFAYGQSETAAGVSTSGGNVTDGDWNIAVVEDLGGGLKAGANMALRLRGRDTGRDGIYAITGTSTVKGTNAASSVVGNTAAAQIFSSNAADNVLTGTAAANGARPRDSSMYVTGAFGTVLVGAIEAGNGILGLVTAGGPTYIGLDNGTTLASASNVDILQYTSPAMSGFTFKVAALDVIGKDGAENGGGITLFGANYAQGPLSVAADMTNFGTAYSNESRTRISANYDLGMARVGAGYQTAENAAGTAKKETAFSVSVPVGAINIGGIYATSNTDGVAGDNTGFDLAIQYNLSKRTYVAFQAQSTKAAGASASATRNQVQLAHSF